MNAGPREAKKDVTDALTLRNATLADLEEIAVIERASFSDPWSEAEFASVLGAGHTIFLIAGLHESDAIAGYVIAMSVVDQAEILNIAVSPECRGAGLGGELLDAALLEVGKRGAATVYLEVRLSNVAARALYASRGFVELSRRKGYYRSPVEDALVLQREIIG